jgi:putative aldouronate transport system substrate-binding protein
MVDRHPTNEAGQKIYGISLWSDWDAGIAMRAAQYPMNMFSKFIPAGFLEVEMGTGAVNSFLDDNSAYKQAVKFFFTANQMGIVDPDSITQNWDTFLEKGTAGRNRGSATDWYFSKTKR